MHTDTQYIEDRLMNGNDIQDALFRDAKGLFYDHLQFFLTITSLEQAIESAHDMMHFQQGIKKKLFQRSAYPLFILFFSYIMLVFFSGMILPQMMEGFLTDSQHSNLLFFVHILQASCNGILIFCVLMLLVALFLLKQDALRLRFVLCLNRHSSFIYDYNSYLFAGYLLQLEERGISTKQSIYYLNHAHKNIVFQYFIQQIQQQLEQGVDLVDMLEENVLLNHEFRQSFRIGVMTASLTNILKTFLLQQEVAWDRKMKRYALYIQLLAYSFVGVLVVLVYQIMLIPLSMLETM